jgi:uncharacterized damage-inducible protein DinB
MNELDHLVDDHRRALEGDAWHGPALNEVLRGVTAKRAAARPIAEAHTIWEIVLHIEAWDRVVMGRLAGKPIELSDEENWPTIRVTTEAAWKRATKLMVTTHGKLSRAIAALDVRGLDKPYVPGGQNNLAHLLAGITQHELYHAGQIAVLKKARIARGA